MKLSIRLVLLASTLTAFSMIIGFLSIISMANINDDIKEISQNWLPTVKTVGELNSMVNEYRRNELVHILTTDEAMMRQYEKKIQTNFVYAPVSCHGIDHDTADGVCSRKCDG